MELAPTQSGRRMRLVSHPADLFLLISTLSHLQVCLPAAGITGLAKLLLA